MIDFVDKKYGRVRIYDREDLPTCIEEKGFDIVGLRNIKRKSVVLVKNRYRSHNDYKTEQFILNYGEEKFEPILTRFEILDL